LYELRVERVARLEVDATLEALLFAERDFRLAGDDFFAAETRDRVIVVSRVGLSAIVDKESRDAVARAERRVVRLDATLDDPIDETDPPSSSVSATCLGIDPILSRSEIAFFFPLRAG
jgi:hypothetical protein